MVALNAEREEMGREVIKFVSVFLLSLLRPFEANAELSFSLHRSRDMMEDETLYCQSEDDGELMIRGQRSSFISLPSFDRLR